MKVVWTNEPPVTTTNLMVIRDESGQITSVANLIQEQAQKYDAQERPDMLYPAIAASFTPYSRFPLTMMTCSQNISSPS